MIKIIEHTTLNDLHGRLLSEIPNGASVLDVGAGLAKYHELISPPRTSKLTLVDAHEPYLQERKARFPREHADLTMASIHGEALSVLRGLPVGAHFDVILGIDFIEHLSRPDAISLVGEMKYLASKVILFTPEGNHPQDTDHYGLGGDHWQTHRSTWRAEDFEALGFETERWVDFHRWAADRGCDPGALWAVWGK